MSDKPAIEWIEGGQAHSARWRSEAGAAPPRRVEIVDDTLTADKAWALASEGAGLLWRSDFQNARQLLQAMGRRADRKGSKRPAAPTALEGFHQYRLAQGQRARVLAKVLVEIDGDYGISLPRAPDLRQACAQAWGPSDGRPGVVSLRELSGVVGGYEWRKKGVEIAALGEPPNNRIHPHYGVFSPVRGEYLDLIAAAPLPSTQLAFDIGTGTGVIAAILARRGVQRVVATDVDARALACARANVDRLGLQAHIDVLQADLFPPGEAPLIVCNPPWLPARPASPLEHAVYDEGGRMLRGFLAGLHSHLTADGEGWLVLSDLAEHLGLRAPGELQAIFTDAGLRVVARHDIRPRHPKVADESDPLHAARAREITTLWRLSRAGSAV